MKRMKPEPITTAQICSVCGEDWNRHPSNPSVEDCVELLKGELHNERCRVTPIWVNPYPNGTWYPTYPYITRGATDTGTVTKGVLDANSN